MRDRLNGRKARWMWHDEIGLGKRFKQLEHSRIRGIENRQWQNEALQELAEEEYEDLFRDERFNPSSPDWHAAVSNLIDER